MTEHSTTQSPIPRKGIILAGGSGTRLWPITISVSKQLIPVYDKPMIYYPLSILMLTGITQICLITTPQDQPQFEQLLGDGKQWGLNLSYIAQSSPDGLAQAYILAEDFLAGAPSAMVLGDNLFFGHGLSQVLARADARIEGGTVFGYHVTDPQRYGVLEFDEAGAVTGIIEKPAEPPSNYAVTGLYFLDSHASKFARSIKPSTRGELEIVDLLNIYLQKKCLNSETLGRGYAWLDTGTPASLIEAGNFVRMLTERQGLQVGSPDEISYHSGWISRKQLQERANLFAKTDYGSYLSLVSMRNPCHLSQP